MVNKNSKVYTNTYIYIQQDSCINIYESVYIFVYVYDCVSIYIHVTYGHITLKNQFPYDHQLSNTEPGQNLDM